MNQKRCRSCGVSQSPGEYGRIAGHADRMCRTCRAARITPEPVSQGDGSVAIPLGGKNAQGRVAYVSDVKLPLVAGYRWRCREVTRSNGTKEGPYAVTTIPTGKRGGRVVQMHTLITGLRGVDHADGDGLNNRDGNLRKANQSQNLANQAKQRRATSSRFKGVSWNRHISSGYWVARVKVAGRVRVRYFHDETEAARAYDEMATETHGPFARTNVALGLLPPLDRTAL